MHTKCDLIIDNYSIPNLDHDTYSSTELSVWFLTTSGFQAIGADEVVLLLEMNSEFDNGTEEFDSEQTRYILELLLQFDDIFTRSLVPLDSHYSPQHSLDDRMGLIYLHVFIVKF